MPKSRTRVSKVFNDIVIHKMSYDYNANKRIGNLVVEYQSGLEYHYKDVSVDSVNRTMQSDEKFIFTAHNKYIESIYPKSKKVYTSKWSARLESERKKQYLAKANANRRARKEKQKEKVK